VNPRYFHAMQIPLRKGRFFSEQDAQGAPAVLLINEALARRYWPGQNPIGKRIGNGRPDGWMSVVGVVGDIHHMNLAAPPDPEIFFPFAQRPQTDMKLTMRTSSDPMRFVPLLRQSVKELDREQPVSSIASLEQARSDSLSTNRFSALLLGIFAAVALLLATLGIYGVISFSVEQRRHDIGIRMALGALRSDVLRMVVGQGIILTIIGIGSGLIAAFALMRVLDSLLFGVKATDPLIFFGVAILFALIAVLASYIPARRATRVDPMVALRYE
jgi:putative ABC transport system permease protein